MSSWGHAPLTGFTGEEKTDHFLICDQTVLLARGGLFFLSYFFYLFSNPEWVSF